MRSRRRCRVSGALAPSQRSATDTAGPPAHAELFDVRAALLDGLEDRITAGRHDASTRAWLGPTARRTYESLTTDENTIESPIGLLVVATAVRAGAAEVVAMNLHEHPLQIARELGATATLPATDVDGVAAVDADATIKSSGSPRGLAYAVRGTTRGGRVVMLGLQSTGEQPALLSLIVTREVKVVGSFRFVDEIDDVLAALADGSLHVVPVITHAFPAAEALSAFEVASQPAVSKVLLNFQGHA